ncbi:protein UXT homolog [Harpegnathos saltator]|uniref:Protein UXT-like protein n=1 Tax=Harpegnathos saltator TaxID=610380 RepID=E2C992_HARSA|nr:protein UXT homolog [Harpegnathos saltator]XP_011152936.1 protein UXT homolog [Harpegnathos saltator]XP_025155356.1 protein UXT homolog [Harpegnathos saltator]EFN75499.1 Protein UXT-like protein [Harpegnathos saltator]
MDPDVQKKILEFEAFVNDVLKADLAQLSDKLDSKNADIAEFIQLKSIITTFQNTDIEKTGFKTQVDIGNSFFVQAQVTDASKILLNIGLGLYVEFTLNEALVVINVRIKLLEGQIANLRRAIARTNAHIKLILLCIRNIKGIK